MRLENKVVVVTGAGRGIGREIATMMAREGAAVIAVDLNDACEITASAIRTSGGKARSIVCDVSKKDSVEMMVEQAVHWNGGVDVLVNNAGITRDGLISKLPEEHWDAVLTVNLKSMFLCIKGFLNSSVEKKFSSVINIASVAGEMGNIGQANYSAAKAGVIGMTKTLAKELARNQIRVNAVAPGFIDTEMTQAIPDKAKEFLISTIPLRRIGLPSDVAAACVFLASEESAYITGQVIRVNGGMYV